VQHDHLCFRLLFCVHCNWSCRSTTDCSLPSIALRIERERERDSHATTTWTVGSTHLPNHNPYSSLPSPQSTSGLRLRSSPSTLCIFSFHHACTLANFCFSQVLIMLDASCGSRSLKLRITWWFVSIDPIIVETSGNYIYIYISTSNDY
jgi:hypothetical protein